LARDLLEQNDDSKISDLLAKTYSVLAYWYLNFKKQSKYISAGRFFVLIWW